MKLSQLLMFITCLTFFLACKKTETPVLEDKKYEVSFMVSDFTTNVEVLKGEVPKISEVGDTLRNHADYLYYYVFNSSGSLVHTMTQNWTSPIFGRISDVLPSGTYTVLFVACKGSLQFTDSQSLNTIRTTPEV